MKPHLLTFSLLSLASGACVLAQNSAFQSPPSGSAFEAGSAAGAFPTVQRSPEQLDQLLGPIALYPDALIALILPSSTDASDVVLAARYFNGGGDVAQIEAQSWDDSVKALAHYPDVVKWMDENLTWTKQVGESFIAQPADVMKSIQRLRAEARAAGTLVDTPQQQIYAEGDTITIVPAQPDTIYVPYYDPDVVYLSRRDYYPGPYLTFSAGYAAGFWLGYDVDWSHRRIWVVERNQRERYWREHQDWRRSGPPPGSRVDREPVRQTWHPNPVNVRTGHQLPANRPQIEVVRPGPISRGQPPYVHGQPAPGASGPRGNLPSGQGPDRGPGNREPSPASPETRRYSPTRPEHPYPSPLPGQVQPITTPPPAYNRGYRVAPQPEEHGPRENQERGRPSSVPLNNSIPATGRFSPGQAQPNAPATQPHAPAVRHEPQHTAPVAPAPAPQAPPAAAPATPAAPAPQPQDEGGRGRRGGNDRAN